MWVPIRREFGRPAVVTMTVLLILAAIWVFFKGVRVLIDQNQWRWWKGGILAVCFLIFFQFFWIVDTLIEQIHFFEYGFFSYLTYRCMNSTWPRLEFWPLRFAVLGLSMGVGILDERIQYLLPNRVGEIRDVGLNILAAFLGLVITGLMEDPRRREKLSHVQT